MSSENEVSISHKPDREILSQGLDLTSTGLLLLMNSNLLEHGVKAVETVERMNKLYILLEQLVKKPGG